jgi:hypothetical protein
MGFDWLSGSTAKNGQKRRSTAPRRNSQRHAGFDGYPAAQELDQCPWGAIVGAGGILPVPAMKN